MVINEKVFFFMLIGLWWMGDLKKIADFGISRFWDFFLRKYVNDSQIHSFSKNCWFRDFMIFLEEFDSKLPNPKSRLRKIQKCPSARRLARPPRETNQANETPLSQNLTAQPVNNHVFI